MESVCGRESSVSPPTVVAPVAVKPAVGLTENAGATGPTDQQRLLYQLALAERLRLASAGLAWARPPITAHHHHLQDAGVGGHLVGGLMSGHLLGGLGSPLVSGLTTGGFPSGLLSGGSASHPTAYPPPHPALYGYPRALFDPRALLPRGPEEPKPQHSYIGLIALAILSSPEKKLVLSDIYQYILDHYPYFRSRGPGWRNSIRHNLSLNDCFVKAGRSANGKGHYWAIHPANIDDFRRGDFRRRRAQRRVRKHLGLAVDDDSSSEPPSPPPALTSTPDTPTPAHHHHQHSAPLTTPDDTSRPQAASPSSQPPPPVARKRQFDVASLLAPDDKLAKTRRQDDHHNSHHLCHDHGLHHNHHHHDHHEIDVVSDDAGDEIRPPVASLSPTSAATHEDEDDDDPRPWSLLGWVSGAPWPLQTPTTTDEGVPRSSQEPPAAQ